MSEDKKALLPAADKRFRRLIPIGLPLVSAVARWVYHARVERFAGEPDQPYLVLMNHVTVWDQFFVVMAMRRPVYFVISEDFMSNGFTSRLIEYLFAPVPIRKQVTDLRAVMGVVELAKSGVTLCIAPEGNRTYSGHTCHINPAIGKLAKIIGLPVALFRIDGGYGVQPRWSDAVRRGRMKAGFTRVISAEELKKMKPAEVNAAIREGLYENEAAVTGRFRHRKRAEYIERMVYTCPSCGLAKWVSRGNEARCTRCGRRIRYGEDKRIEGVDGLFPYRFAGEWYDAQERFVMAMDGTEYVDRPAFTDEAGLWRVKLYDRKERVEKSVRAALYSDRIELTSPAITRVFRFDETDAVTVLGQNKLNIYAGDDVWQLKGSKRFNALKYVNFFFHAKNMAAGGASRTQKGTDGAEFLGL